MALRLIVGSESTKNFLSSAMTTITERRRKELSRIKLMSIKTCVDMVATVVVAVVGAVTMTPTGVVVEDEEDMMTVTVIATGMMIVTAGVTTMTVTVDAMTTDVTTMIVIDTIVTIGIGREDAIKETRIIPCERDPREERSYSIRLRMICSLPLIKSSRYQCQNLSLSVMFLSAGHMIESKGTRNDK
mmetsp:Transcript_21891/g.29787  ORF Transcript_21891/g.29787 Transcript_21891/m.29787 type:complete len:187 (+) Transcript_21891:1053-1613(+)